MKTVIIFRTNVLKLQDSILIIAQLKVLYTKHRISFDLEDCDKILRIEGDKIDPFRIRDLVRKKKYCCDLIAIMNRKLINKIN